MNDIEFVRFLATGEDQARRDFVADMGAEFLKTRGSTTYGRIPLMPRESVTDVCDALVDEAKHYDLTIERVWRMDVDENCELLHLATHGRRFGDKVS
jgi:hypothetical protein